MIDIKVEDVKWNEKGISNKVESLLNESTLVQIQTLFAQTIDPWTPFLTGKLHETYSVDSEGVTYLVPYAAKKYYGTVYCKSNHPLATDHWDQVAMQTELPAFEEKVKQILIERAKEIYG